MDFRKKMKGFMTLTRTANGGFTLVELIVVIAILAILAGVGIPVYSGYITKANKQADITLANEVANSLLLQYYNNYDEPTSDYVILSADDAVAGGQFATDAMNAAFGANWASAAKLKHDGWTSAGSDVAENYFGSSLAGGETSLLETADKLSGTLKVYMESKWDDDEGKAFKQYLTENGIQNGDTGVGNAAVLYVAQVLEKADQEKIVSILSDISFDYVKAMMTNPINASPESAVAKAVVALQSEVKSNLVVAALLYAYAESYCRSIGGTKAMPIFNPDEIASGEVGVAEVKNAFVNAMAPDPVNDPDGSKGAAYVSVLIENGAPAKNPNSPAVKDARAVLAALSAVHAASDSIMEEINEENLYTKKSNFIETYLEAAKNMVPGQVMVIIDEEGNVLIDGLSEAE